MVLPKMQRLLILLCCSMGSWLSESRRVLASEVTQGTVDTSSAAGAEEEDPSETKWEFQMDLLLGIAFCVTAGVATKRMMAMRNQGGAETTVVTAFYLLIFLTSILRAIWFFVPSKVWQPTSYAPIAVYAWSKPTRDWVGAALSEFLVTAGSLALFAIFILILVYWADILKKYFHPAARRSLPMMTFLTLVAVLLILALTNFILYLCRLYTTEGMILVNAAILAAVSMFCVVEISIFSHRFRTVLKTLGAINQVSTDSQVQRIVWITVTGNLFFVTRAVLETGLVVALVLYYQAEGTVARVFAHSLWDTYVAVKYTCEIIILALMLYILQSRFASAAPSGSGGGRPAGYVRVPNNEPQPAAGSKNGSKGGTTASLNV